MERLVHDPLGNLSIHFHDTVNLTNKPEAGEESNGQGEKEVELEEEAPPNILLMH